jgi:hypothetical protein
MSQLLGYLLVCARLAVFAMERDETSFLNILTDPEIITRSGFWF